MKKTLFILLVAVGILFAFQAFAVRYDWTGGQPTAVEDITTSTSRYDWTNGQPAIVIQLPPPPAAVQQDDNGSIILLDNSAMTVSDNAQVNL